MADLFEQVKARGKATVAVASCVPEETLISAKGFSGVHDPHVWFDVGAWAHTPRCVAEALSIADPSRADSYRSRAAAYEAELGNLHGWVGERLARIPKDKRVLVTAHDAFSYFGRAYGLEVRGLLGVSTASEAGTADIQALADFIARRRIPAIFVESSVPPRYIQAVQQAVSSRGFEVAIGGSLFSDALGDPGTPAGTYIGTVRANVETIAAALEGGSGPE
jgi:manganese/zinc/iron transport system substrate-binding protein